MHPEGCGSSKALPSNEQVLPERWPTAGGSRLDEASSGLPAQPTARPSANTRPASGRSHIWRHRILTPVEPGHLEPTHLWKKQAPSRGSKLRRAPTSTGLESTEVQTRSKATTRAQCQVLGIPPINRWQATARRASPSNPLEPKPKRSGDLTAHGRFGSCQHCPHKLRARHGRGKPPLCYALNSPDATAPKSSVVEKRTLRNRAGALAAE